MSPAIDRELTLPSSPLRMRPTTRGGCTGRIARTNGVALHPLEVPRFFEIFRTRHFPVFNFGFDKGSLDHFRLAPGHLQIEKGVILRACTPLRSNEIIEIFMC